MPDVFAEDMDSSPWTRMDIADCGVSSAGSCSAKMSSAPSRSRGRRPVQQIGFAGALAWSQPSSRSANRNLLPTHHSYPVTLASLIPPQLEPPYWLFKVTCSFHDFSFKISQLLKSPPHSISLLPLLLETGHGLSKQPFAIFYSALNCL